jgi:hypothetical protein
MSSDPNWHDGRCVKCGKPRTKEGHDPCIANLPGVKYACCGHGREDGYICFENGGLIRMQIISTERPRKKRFQ